MVIYQSGNQQIAKEGKYFVLRNKKTKEEQVFGDDLPSAVDALRMAEMTDMSFADTLQSRQQKKNLLGFFG